MSRTKDGDICWADKSCKDAAYYTPPEILESVREYFGGQIPLDPATSVRNQTEALRFFTPMEDGLAQSWEGDGVFLNPPYGKNFRFRDWVAKIHEEAAQGVTILALLPCGARFSTGYWQDDILTEYVNAVCFIKGRVAFLREDGSVAGKGQNPYDSMLYGYNVGVEKFSKCFWHLGKCFRWEAL